jgi:hypothetical protein
MNFIVSCVFYTTGRLDYILWDSLILGHLNEEYSSILLKFILFV